MAAEVDDLAKQKLMMAIGARLERSEHEVTKAAVDWLEVTAAPAADGDLRRRFMVRAMGEIWRRERLRHLYAEVRVGTHPIADRMVYFMAVDGCDPKTIPSFVDWLAERAPGLSVR